MSHAAGVIGPEHWTNMAWRNGGGTTSEIFAETREGKLLWRLSTAIVERDGPYSKFPGLTRISTVVEGRGAKIAEAIDGDWRKIAPLSPTRIDGNHQIEGRLLNGSVRYLNLFFDPEWLSGHVSVIPLNGRARTGNEPSSIFCVEGCCEIAPPLGEVMRPMACAMNVPAGTHLDGKATLVSIVLRARVDDKR